MKTITNILYNGKVNWFNDSKGYGFITPDDDGGDVFFHYSPLQDTDFKELKDGDKVEYEIDTTKEKPTAINVRKPPVETAK